MTLLPPNVTPIERALESTMARLADIPVPLRALYDPDTCPPDLLPYLAWALSIDTWSTDWTDEVKRARVRSAIAIQRRKGTARSVRDVVQSFGGEVAIREWWEMQPLGPPHTFSLVLDLDGRSGALTSAAYVEQVVAEVTRTKPVRSHFTFTQALAATSALRPIAVLRPIAFTRLQTAAAAAEVLLSFDFTGGTLPPGAALARASAATRFNAAGLLVVEGAHVPRFDYDPGTLAPRGILIEPQRTNLATRSSEMTTLPWALYNSTSGTLASKSNLGTAPDGTLSADKFTSLTVTEGYAIVYYQNSAVINNPVFSTFLQGAVGGEDLYLIIQGSLPNGPRLQLSSAYKRFETTLSQGQYFGFGTHFSRPGTTQTPASSYFAWGAQVELAGAGERTGASSYIPTTTATATRAADVLTLFGPTGTYRFSFDDGTTQDVALVASSGVVTVPTNLRRAWIKRAVIL